MPWDVKKRGSQYCVVKQGESSPVPGGCHSTKEAARAHQKALYASESGGAVVGEFIVDEFAKEMSARLKGHRDRMAVYADAVSEGSEMTEDTLEHIVVPDGFHSLFNSSGQTIGFIQDKSAPAEEAAPSEKPWSGILAVVGSPTSDKRYLIPDEIGNRDLPIPLQVQLVTSEGHDGAHTAGRIDSIEFTPLKDFDERDEFNLDGVHEDAIIVFGMGVLDGSEAAVEAERLIANGAGISIDLPPDRMALIDPETFEELDPADVDMGDVLSGKYLTGIGGKIAAATIVTIPAFEEAEIGLEEDSVLVASAYGQSVFGLRRGEATDEPREGIEVQEGEWGTLPAESAWKAARTLQALVAMAAPLKPDADWFKDPGLKKLTPLTITPEGQVYGHLADWDGCHTGFSNVCVPPFRSQTDYAYFNTGEIECEDSTMVAVGKLMFSMDGGKHASTSLNALEASKHYDDSTKVGAFVRAGTDRYGTWLAGALRPGLTDEEVQHLRSHPPSGDWRPIQGKGTELVAAFAVAVGGFPIPRAMVASGEHGELTIISAPLDLELGPHALRRRFEMSKKKRKSMRPYDDDQEAALADTAASRIDAGRLVFPEEDGMFREIPTSTRKRMAKAGTAMPDGSFPIANCSDAKNARRAIGRTPESRRGAVKAHIAKREKALGCAKPEN